jgi:dipeptidyl aminopeptidase/acylaminoacyl peptidase
LTTAGKAEIRFGFGLEVVMFAVPVFLVLSLLSGASPARAETRPLKVDDIYALREVADPQVSPEGDWVAYTVTTLMPKADESNDDLWMSPFGGGEAVRLTSSRHSEKSPRFSPDGKWLAFLSGREGGKKSQVWLMSRRGGEAFRLTRLKGGVSWIAWSPDSRRLALVARDPDPDEDEEEDELLWTAEEATPGDAEAAKDRLKKLRKKTAKPLVIQRRQFKRDEEGYLRELRNHVYVLDVEAKAAVQITSGTYDDTEPQWSPDGKLIAFTSNRTADPDSNQNSDVFVVEARAEAKPRALTTSPGEDKAPRFSPDGREVVYVAGDDPKNLWYGPSHVGVVPVAGGAERDLTSSLDRNVLEPQFTPDGASILFLLEDGGNAHLCRVPAQGGPVERLVTGERDIEGFHVGARGQIAVLESRPQQPSEVSAVEAGGALRRLSTVNDEFLKGIRLGSVQRFQARSADGTRVDGFLTLPPAAPAGKKLPTILRIHGGPASQYSTAFELEWQLLAAHGFAVVACNPRGSTGHGLAFSRAIWADWGNRDFEDVMAAVDHVIAMGVADPDRLGVGGWSYGGILTDYVITKSTRFKAAVSGASEANYLANYGTDHYQYEWETELGLPWRARDLWVRLSPWFDVEKVTAPTLVMGGADDMNVPLLNSEQLYQALRRIGRVDTELVIYPGEHHGIEKPSFQKDRYERYIAWYDKYLRPVSARP